MREKKFILKPYVFLVEGVKRGALYDLETGEIYSIDENSKKILLLCENGELLGQIAAKFPGLHFNDLIDYLNELRKLEVGDFAEKTEIIEKIKLDPPEDKLDFIWLELTERCNLKCVHCYGCFGEKECKKKHEELNLDEWRQVIKEAHELGCRKIQFIGGEPLIFGKGLLELIRVARDLDFKVIEVFTNATLLTDEFINFFAENSTYVAVSVYSKKAEVHDSITQIKGSWRKTIGNIEKMKKRGINVRVGLIAMKQNEDDIEETVKFLKERFSIDNIRPDIVRPSGGGCGNKLISEKCICRLYKRKPEFLKISKDDFKRKKFGHNCFLDRVCVTATGGIIPCIMCRNKELGNIRSDALADIFNSKNALEVRGLNKDKISVCQDCEYRYACFDCRVRDIKEGDLFNSKPIWCLYEPRRGEWMEEEQGGEN